MSNERARSRLLAAAFALSSLTAACDATSVDLGSDITSRSGGHSGSPQLDAGSRTPGSGGSSQPGSGGSGGGAAPVLDAALDDAASVAQIDAAMAVDAGPVDPPDAGRDAGGCAAQLADCDGLASNGCEVDLSADDDNCGECDRACPPFGFMSSGSSCIDGHCVLECQAPHDDCDNEPDNGCEADLRFGASADENCGACGVTCDCDNGVCR